MSEICPQFTFSPEGVFSFERGQPEIITHQDGPESYQEMDIDLEAQRDRSQDWLEELPGVEIENNGPTQTISIPVAEALAPEIAANDSAKIEELVISASVLLPQSLPTGPEQVLSAQGISFNRVDLAAHIQFQRWLNYKPLTDRETLRCVKAMAVPFGREVEAEADFDHRESDTLVLAEGAGFKVQSQFENFGFLRYFEKSGHTYQVAGDDQWDWIGLKLPGNGVVEIGVDGLNKSGIQRSQNSSRLYIMKSYNVQQARQALSLLLGMGSLAYNAALYPGREDVFEDVEWDVPQSWPYPIPKAA